MSTLLVLVLLAVVAFGCSDTESEPRPADAQRVEDPTTSSAPTSSQAQDEGSVNDEGSVEGSVEESAVAADLALDPTGFRDRWNALVGAADDGSLEAQFLEMGELQPVDDPGTLSAFLGAGAFSEEAAATVAVTLSADGTLTAIMISLTDDPNATEIRRTLTQAALSRLLLASTLPSRPALNDPAVTDPAEALSLHGRVVAEGVTYSTDTDEEGWTLVARVDP